LLCRAPLALRLLAVLRLRGRLGGGLLGRLLVPGDGRGGSRTLSAAATAASAPAARLRGIGALGRGGLLSYGRGFGGRLWCSLCRRLLGGVVTSEPAEWQVESPSWARARPSPKSRRRACSGLWWENMGMSLSQEGSSR